LVDARDLKSLGTEYRTSSILVLGTMDIRESAVSGDSFFCLDEWIDTGQRDTLYTLVNSIMVFTFSGFASSMTVELSMMKPPPLPTISISFLQ
jgi:hypothetical protein